MNKTIQSTVILLLALILLAALVACDSTQAQPSLWDNATYQSDTELGNGTKTIKVQVIVQEEQATFTIHTDKDTVGAALLEYDLIAGEQGAYGLYIKVVNGITADYDVDQSYWAFQINGEYAMTGVDLTEIT